MKDAVDFDALVSEALDSLPHDIARHMRNVQVLIDTWPSKADLYDAGVPPGYTLLGLYSGIPLTERVGYNLVVPDTITLYRGPIEEEAGTDPDALRELVRHVTIHEIAHHFGISDERLIELGVY